MEVEVRMREIIVNSVIGLLKAYLWLILLPFGLFGFFADE